MREKITMTLDDDLVAQLRRLTRKRDDSAAVEAALREYLGAWNKVVKNFGGPEHAPKATSSDGFAALGKFVRKKGWDGKTRPPVRAKKKRPQRG